MRAITRENILRKPDTHTHTHTRSFYSEARSAEREKETSYGNALTVIDACGLCRGVNLSADNTGDNNI